LENISVPSSGGATGASSRRYLYDGWNLIAEFNAPGGTSIGSLVRSYTWGLDIVHSLTSAGGVGALLQIADHATGKTYLPTYDGKGNVASLVNADTGSTAAAYEYSPFGEPLRSQTIDATVAEQPFRFSTKFTDLETGLVYYGRRYYDPLLGRFICRDPKEELGGINLYGFVGNNAINRWDYLGMCEGEEEENDNSWDYLGEDDGGLLDWMEANQRQAMAEMNARRDAEQAQQAAQQTMARQAGTVTTPDVTQHGIVTNLGGQVTAYQLPNGNWVELGAPGQAANVVRYAPDGKLTLGEANSWYRNGNGVPVVVDASLYDFSKVNPNGFGANATQLYSFPKFQGRLPSQDFLVNGTVTLQLNPGGQTFTVRPDTYDFDIHYPFMSRLDRNVDTILGSCLAGNNGIPFDIIFRGSVPVSPPSDSPTP
jgi:RHS repeat-associated protein